MTFANEMRDFISAFKTGYELIPKKSEDELAAAAGDKAVKDAEGKGWDRDVPVQSRASTEQPGEQQRERERIAAIDDEGVGENPGRSVRDAFMQTVKGKVTNPFALAVIDATGKHESGWNASRLASSWADPSESGQPGQSGGAMSWRAERLEALRRSAGDRIGDPRAHAEFFLNEDPRLIAQLNSAGSIEEANRTMANAWRFAGYNRPGGEFDARLGTARSLLPQYQQQQQAGRPQRHSALPEDELGSHGAMRPVAFASEGGVIPDEQQMQTQAIPTSGWQAQGPTANGSVFTGYTPQQGGAAPSRLQQFREMRAQQPAYQPPQTALPTAEGNYSERFRNLRSQHAERQAAEQARQQAQRDHELAMKQRELELAQANKPQQPDWIPYSIYQNGRAHVWDPSREAHVAPEDHQHYRNSFLP
jgi:hypothetical protein